MLIALSVLAPQAVAQDDAIRAALDQRFARNIAPLVEKYCHDCHSGAEAEAEINLQAFKSLEDMRRQTNVWQKAAAMLKSRQMPPTGSEQPTEDERTQLENWLHSFLMAEARAFAGDPGPVVLRRLSNAEYTYTVRDLTGVKSLNPTREFPVDGGAGEGFTNTGASLAMSPSLVQKFLAAAKQVTEHAVLVPDGIRFSPFTSQRDWTDELLADIQEIYAKWTVAGSNRKAVWDGLAIETDQGGRLPLEKYLSATVVERDALSSGRT
ncbi:MAG: DUF1587 domain-containing protein, partial [Dechloromonas sp.]|nr:DUF1587 domain-containing protein [Dechloromonas sp.]